MAVTPKTTTRRVYLTPKGTYYIAIPKHFIERHGIKAGDKLVVMTGEVMRVFPPEEELCGRQDR